MQIYSVRNPNVAIIEYVVAYSNVTIINFILKKTGQVKTRNYRVQLQESKIGGYAVLMGVLQLTLG